MDSGYVFNNFYRLLPTFDRWLLTRKYCLRYDLYQPQPVVVPPGLPVHGFVCPIAAIFRHYLLDHHGIPGGHLCPERQWRLAGLAWRPPAATTGGLAGAGHQCAPLRELSGLFAAVLVGTVEIKVTPTFSRRYPSTRVGKVRIKLLPLPGSLRTSTRPLWAVITAFT